MRKAGVDPPHPCRSRGRGCRPWGPCNSCRPLSPGLDRTPRPPPGPPSKAGAAGEERQNLQGGGLQWCPGPFEPPHRAPSWASLHPDPLLTQVRTAQRGWAPPNSTCPRQEPGRGSRLPLSGPTQHLPSQHALGPFPVPAAGSQSSGGLAVLECSQRGLPGGGAPPTSSLPSLRRQGGVPGLAWLTGPWTVAGKGRIWPSCLWRAMGLGALPNTPQHPATLGSALSPQALLAAVGKVPGGQGSLRAQGWGHSCPRQGFWESVGS